MKNKTIYILLGCWVLSISLVLTLMHSWHYIDLRPEEGSISLKTVKGIIPDAKEFGVVHFLTPKCSCSQNIFSHLVKRGPLKVSGVKELVITVDDEKGDFTKELSGKGFQVANFSTKNLQNEFSKSIRGVPLLVIYDNKKSTRYVGGYSSSSITPLSKININNYIQTLKQGRSISSLPVTGCTVSKNYQKILDPLGLKYQKE